MESKGKAEKKVVCIGDSLTYGYGVAEQESWVGILNGRSVGQFVNRGIPGNTTMDMKQRFYQDVILAEPDQVLIMGGTNDLFLNMQVADIIHNINEMTELSQLCVCKPTILVPPLLNSENQNNEWFSGTNYHQVNSKLRQYRQKLIKYAVNNKVQYVDIMSAFLFMKDIREGYLPDGIHVTSEIHHRIAALIADKISC